MGYRACSCFIILVALALVSARPRVAQAADYSATYEPGVVARVTKATSARLVSVVES